MSPLRSELLVIGGVALAIVAILSWAKNKIVAGVEAGAINPGNPDNFVNQAAQGIVQAATGDPNQSLVGWVDDVLGINQGLAPGETLNSSGQIVAASYSATRPSRSLERMLPDGSMVY